MDNNLCCFCGCETQSTANVCQNCLTKVKLDLRPSNSENCPCGEHKNLVVIKYDGIKKAFCPHHLPTPVAATLASQLTNSFGFMNAPNVYGNFETFINVQKLSTYPTRENINLLVKVINKFNQINQIQYV